MYKYKIHRNLSQIINLQFFDKRALLNKIILISVLCINNFLMKQFLFKDLFLTKLRLCLDN